MNRRKREKAISALQDMKMADLDATPTKARKKKRKRHIQESCSCGSAIVAKHSQVLKWRKEHRHSEIRELQSATQRSGQDDVEEYEDSTSNHLKMGFQPNEDETRPEGLQ